MSARGSKGVEGEDGFTEEDAWAKLQWFRFGSIGQRGYYAHNITGKPNYMYLRDDLRFAFHPCVDKDLNGEIKKCYTLKIPEYLKDGKWYDVHCWEDFNE